MPEQIETPATVLRAAAKRIREKGLNRGAYCNWGTGAVCAHGAIHNIRRPSDVDQLARLEPWTGDPRLRAGIELGRYVIGQLGQWTSVAEWNDRIAKDGEEVAVTMEKAAARWEENHAG